MVRQFCLFRGWIDSLLQKSQIELSMPREKSDEWVAPINGGGFSPSFESSSICVPMDGIFKK